MTTKTSRKPAAKGPTAAKLAELESKIEQLPTKPANVKSGSRKAVAAAIKEAPADKAQDAATKEVKAPTARPADWKLSTTEKPTKKVWAIADQMPGASRKDVIAACIAAGIGAGTSRTQYQAWFKAMRDSGTPAR